MIIASGSYGKPQQILIIVDRFDHGAKEQEELRVLIRSGAGREQVLAAVCGDGPVVVLAAAVDAREGFFMQQADQAVPGCDLLHDLHGQLVVVGRDIGGRIDGSQFVLGRRHFVMLCLGQNAQLPELFVQVFHKGRDAGLDHAEIVIIQLLALGRPGAEQGPAGEAQIGALFIHFTGDQKILLLRSDGGYDAPGAVISEQAEDSEGLFAEDFHGTEQGCFLVKGLSAVGTEGCGDTKGSAFDEGIGGRIPGGIAPCFKSGAETS